MRKIPVWNWFGCLFVVALSVTSAVLADAQDKNVVKARIEVLCKLEKSNSCSNKGYYHHRVAEDDD